MLYSTLNGTLNFLPITHTDHRSNSVRTLSALHHHEKSASAAASPAYGLLGRRPDRGRPAAGKIGYLTAGCTVAPSTALLATVRGRARCGCCRGNLDEALAEVARVLDYYPHSPVPCRICSLVINQSS